MQEQIYPDAAPWASGGTSCPFPQMETAADCAPAAVISYLNCRIPLACQLMTRFELYGVLLQNSFEKFGFIQSTSGNFSIE